MNQQQAQDIVNKLAVSFSKSKKSGIEILKSLSDTELTAFIAIDTMNYGRKWNDSIDNALFHMQNRSRAEKLFGTSNSDFLGAK